MTDKVYLNRERTKVVPEWSVDKKWQIPRAEAVKLGLLSDEEEPAQERRTAPQKRRSAPRKKK